MKKKLKPMTEELHEEFGKIIKDCKSPNHVVVVFYKNGVKIEYFSIEPNCVDEDVVDRVNKFNNKLGNMSIGLAEYIQHIMDHQDKEPLYANQEFDQEVIEGLWNSFDPDAKCIFFLKSDKHHQPSVQSFLQKENARVIKRVAIH